MHTLSSASRTCIASASAVECTATVAIPSSLQARSTRNAISPRLAMRILSNIAMRSLDDHQRLAELHRMAILDQDLDHRAGARRRNLVHSLHRLDDEQRIAYVDDEARARLGSKVGGTDHRGGDDARMLHRIAR